MTKRKQAPLTASAGLGLSKGGATPKNNVYARIFYERSKFLEHNGGWGKKRAKVPPVARSTRPTTFIGAPLDYETYLESEHWKSIRVAYFLSGLPQECFICQATKFELHHRNYQCLGAETWNDLVPLCRTHHLATHRLVKTGVPLANAHTYLIVKTFFLDGRENI